MHTTRLYWKAYSSEDCFDTLRDEYDGLKTELNSNKPARGELYATIALKKDKFYRIISDLNVFKLAAICAKTSP